MRELVIHAGIHRTGTSAIQHTFAKNRQALKDAGYLYPGARPNHQDWVSKLRKTKTARDLLAFIEEESDDITHTVILSGEDFCRDRNLGWVRELSGEFDNISVRLFARRQDDWMMSWYNQHLKWPWNKEMSVLTPEEFLDRIDDFYWIDYEWLGSNWADVVGAENVHLTPMPKDPTAALLAELVPDVNAELVPGHSNESVPAQALDVLRHINALDVPPNVRIRIVKALRQEFGSDIEPVFTRAQRQAVTDRFAASNARASTRFFNGKPLFSFESEGAEKYTPLTEPEIIARMANVIGDLAREKTT